MVVEVEASTFGRIAEEPDIETKSSPQPRVHPARVQPLPGEGVPGRGVQPGDPGTRGAPGHRLRHRSRADQRDRRRRAPRSSPTRSCRPGTQDPSTPSPSRPIRSTRSWPTRSSTTPGGCRTGTSPAPGTARSSRSISTRASESPYTMQAAKLIAEMAQEIGVEFNVQIVSTDKLTELTVRKVDGKPAPEFDTFIWGWGGDPYDPSFLLSLHTTNEIGSFSDGFFSNPEYDALYRGAARRLRRRRAQGDHRRDARTSRPTTSSTSSSPRTRTCRPGARTGSPTSSRSARRRTATSSASRSPTSRVLALEPAFGSTRARRRRPAGTPSWRSRPPGSPGLWRTRSGCAAAGGRTSRWSWRSSWGMRREGGSP